MRPADWESKVLVRRITPLSPRQRKIFGELDGIPNWFESKDDYETTLENCERYLEENPDDGVQTEVIQVVVANYALVGRPLPPPPAPVQKVEVYEP
jgi:hypothetical protein